MTKFIKVAFLSTGLLLSLGFAGCKKAEDAAASSSYNKCKKMIEMGLAIIARLTKSCTISRIPSPRKKAQKRRRKEHGEKTKPKNQRDVRKFVVQMAVKHWRS